MKEKLKMLKYELKSLNRLMFGSIEKNLEDVRSLDEKGEDNPLIEVEVEVEVERRRIWFRNFI